MFNKILKKKKKKKDSQRVEPWRSKLMPIYNNNGNIQNAPTTKGLIVKLMSHKMKLRERE